MHQEAGTDRATPVRVALVANTSWYLANFRRETIERLVDDGWDVVAVAPDDEYRDRLEGFGARFEGWSFDRRSLSPIAMARAFFRICSLYRRLRPDIVHHFTIKPVILGGIAAHLMRVPGIVQSLTGLGLAFAPANLLHLPALIGYRYALGGGAQVIFQNEDDRALIVRSGVVREENTHLIRGSGVDVARFERLTPARNHTSANFLMACRMLWAKGVREFVEAADIAYAENDGCRFALVGDTDPGTPDAVPSDWLEEAGKRPYLDWWGFRDGVDGALAWADVVVLPSYREGLPKSLLEGAAAGRALIATDVPGCRDVIAHLETGLLVPAGDADALAEAMVKLAGDPDLRSLLASNAARAVRRRFASEIVVDQTRSVYEKTLSRSRAQ